MRTQVNEILFGAGDQAVDSDRLPALAEKPITQMRSQKPRSACDQDATGIFSTLE